jgi:putative oxidoreductase
MLAWLFQTDGSIVPLVLRLSLALVIFPHGAQKTLGWFGGHGFKGTMAFFNKSGIPAGLAFLAIMAEFLGPLGLVVGFLTRVAALGIAVVMLVAITVHMRHGFFMNWFGDQKGEGFEYHLLALGLAVALIISGAGAWSLDAVIAR